MDATQEFIKNLENYEYTEEFEKPEPVKAETTDTVRHEPTIKKNKRSRYLDGVKRARRHYFRMFAEQDPCRHAPRKEITSWMSEEDEAKYKESKETLADPNASPRAKWLATVAHRFRKRSAEFRQRNFGKFRSTRPNIGKDAIWATMVYNAKNQRIKDRLDDTQKDFDSMAFGG